MAGMKPAFVAILSLLSAFLFTQCQTSAPAGSFPASSGSEMAMRTSGGAALAPAPPPLERGRSMALDGRPGLGTQLGREIYDSTTTTRFYRRNSRVPDATATFHYNDEEGAKLMARLGGARFKRGGSFDLIPGKLRVSVKASGSWGSQLKYYEAGGRITVIGRAGSAYELVLTNLTAHRLNVVTSVDGLDVLTGNPASVSGRGYVIAERSSLTIQGMRVGGVLRAFQFSSVASSRAATAFGASGARNVGVVGVALYEEDEMARRRVRVEENYIREGARAFGN